MWWLLVIFFGYSALGLKPDPKMVVLPQWDAHGHDLHTLKITGISVEERDIACHTACQSYEGCDFWVRSTISDDCWLKQKLKETKNACDRRSGFIHGWPRWERLFHLLYDVLSNIIRFLNINLGDAIKHLRIQLPKSVEVGIISAPDSQCRTKNCNPAKFLVQLFNMTIMLHIKEINIPNLVQGSVANHIRASPEFGFNIEKCEVTVVKLNVEGIDLGIDNTVKKTKCLTDMLAGDRHSGFYGQNCGSLLSAYPSTDMTGNDVAHLHVEGTTQDARDKACCKACAADPKCEVFVQDAKHDNCWLKRVSYDASHRDSNIKGQMIAWNKTDIHGKIIAHYVLHEDDGTPADTACARLCAEDHPYCDAWVSDFRNATDCGEKEYPDCHSQDCWLKGVTLPKGLVKKGILGINGESIANVFGSMILKKIINFVLKHICQKDMDMWDKLLNYTDLDTTIIGSGNFNVQVDTEFFSTLNVKDTSQWEATTFPVLSSSLDFKANDQVLQPLVDMFLEELNTTMIGPMANQIAAPAGYLIGGILTKCTQDPPSCGM